MSTTRPSRIRSGGTARHIDLSTTRHADDEVIAKVLDQGGTPSTRTGSGPEFGAVDKFGNVFAGEPRPRSAQIR